MSSAIELHIEELVLDGLRGLDEAQLGAAVQQELQRLLAQPGASQALARAGTAGSVDGGAFETGPDASTHAVGVQIAQSVYRGITPCSQHYLLPAATRRTTPVQHLRFCLHASAALPGKARTQPGLGLPNTRIAVAWNGNLHSRMMRPRRRPLSTRCCARPAGPSIRLPALLWSRPLVTISAKCACIPVLVRPLRRKP